MRLKERLLRGEPTFGTFAFIAAPAVVEIMGLAGLDFVIIDTEHAAIDWQTVENMVRAAEVRQIAPLVRVSRNDEKLILRALETGAEGIVVPFMQTADDARRAGQAMKYPPEGLRGTCTISRASLYGSRRARYGDHMRQANDATVLVGLLEDVQAVENIEDMVRVTPGPDAFLVGRADLASALGASGGGVDDQRVFDATVKIIRAVVGSGRADKIAGIGVYRPEEVEPWFDRGCRLFAYSVDNLVLLSAYQRAVEEYQSTREKMLTAAKGGH